MQKVLFPVALALTLGIAVVSEVSADSIRTSDGISCSFDADDSPWEVEAYGENGREDYDYHGNVPSGNQRDNNKVGVKLSYKFGGPKRLNCDTLYQLELRSKEAKVKELEAKIEALEAASNITWK